MRVLAIETSCDDTCAAVVDGARIESSIVSSQASFHERYGGVVPEVASRRHLELVDEVIASALDEAGAELADLDGVAVTTRPGLIGALLVGVGAAKAYASAHRLPLIPVDHLDGHLASGMAEPDPIAPPYLCLVASGGHTMLTAVDGDGGAELLGSTLDDAAGEALDKGARMLGLGFPGGPAVQAAAESADPRAFAFPVAEPGGLDFSFSGVKTALAYTVREMDEGEIAERRADLAASYQAAICRQLIDRCADAIASGAHPALVLAGGVAANTELRRMAGELCDREGVALKLVPPALCTDNAAMIGIAAQAGEPIPYPGYLGLDAAARRG